MLHGHKLFTDSYSRRHCHQQTRNTLTLDSPLLFRGHYNLSHHLLVATILSIIHVDLCHITPCEPPMSLLEKTAWISGEYRPLGGRPQSLVQLFTDGGALGIFRFGKRTNRTAILFHAPVFVQTHLLSSLNNRVKDCRAYLVLEQQPLCFLGWLYHVAFPQVVTPPLPSPATATAN